MPTRHPPDTRVSPQNVSIFEMHTTPVGIITNVPYRLIPGDAEFTAGVAIISV